MGKLYEACQTVIRQIEARGLDTYRCRGALAMETGFLVSAVGPNDPDDPERVARLRDAAMSLYGIQIP